MRKLALDDEILMSIDKAARYIGGEVNSVMKDKGKVDLRFCMAFPDVYEIGMSNLGMAILYDMFNKREDVWCERLFSPWTDLDKIMREKKIPLLLWNPRNRCVTLIFWALLWAMKCVTPMFCSFWIFLRFRFWPKNAGRNSLL